MALSFLWDVDKAVANQAKHGVSFDEAMTAFRDALSLTIPDPFHSRNESRYIHIGQSYTGRLLVIIHLDRGERIRLISARLATRRERHDYEEGN
jgi:uncharacterized protein